jgi:hypothetical protein
MIPPLSALSEGEKKKWIDLVGQSVYTSDDIDLGNIEAVGNDSIVVRRSCWQACTYIITIFLLSRLKGGTEK